MGRYSEARIEGHLFEDIVRFTGPQGEEKTGVLVADSLDSATVVVSGSVEPVMQGALKFRMGVEGVEGGGKVPVRVLELVPSDGSAAIIVDVTRLSASKQA